VPLLGLYRQGFSLELAASHREAQSTLYSLVDRTLTQGYNLVGYRTVVSNDWLGVSKCIS
jgi:hypothetical protein